MSNFFRLTKNPRTGELSLDILNRGKFRVRFPNRELPRQFASKLKNTKVILIIKRLKSKNGLVKATTRIINNYDLPQKIDILIMLIICSVVIVATENRPVQAKITHTEPMDVKMSRLPDVMGRLPENLDKPLKASWYNYELNNIEWSRTHNTAASRDLERYSYHTVTNVANGKSVVVYINDWVENSDVAIDLSQHAFAQIADLKLGLINIIINLK